MTIIHPYDGPCYACWAAELRDELAKPEDAAELDYGMIGPEGTLEAEPGLWLHVVRVASVQADMALNDLLTGTEIYRSMPGNTVILANTALEIIAGEISPPYQRRLGDRRTQPALPGLRLARAGTGGVAGRTRPDDGHST